MLSNAAITHCNQLLYHMSTGCSQVGTYVHLRVILISCPFAYFCEICSVGCSKKQTWTTASSMLAVINFPGIGPPLDWSTNISIIYGCLSCYAGRLNEASRQLRGYLRRDAGKALRLWASLALLTGYAAHHYTLAHPFLLADNRCAPC